MTASGPRGTRRPAASAQQAALLKEIDLLRRVKDRIEECVPNALHQEIDVGYFETLARIIGEDPAMNGRRADTALSVRRDLMAALLHVTNTITNRREEVLRLYQRRLKSAAKVVYTGGAKPVSHYRAKVSQHKEKSIELKRLDINGSSTDEWIAAVDKYLLVLVDERLLIESCSMSMSEWDKYDFSKSQVTYALWGIWVTAATSTTTLVVDHHTSIEKLPKTILTFIFSKVIHFSLYPIH